MFYFLLFSNLMLTLTYVGRDVTFIRIRIFNHMQLPATFSSSSKDRTFKSNLLPFQC